MAFGSELEEPSILSSKLSENSCLDMEGLTLEDEFLDKYPEMTTIGRTILHLLYKERNMKMVARIYFYVKSTRMFEAFKNNIKTLDIMNDKYYYIPYDVWFE
jgi:hypothetical protein